jgi:PAB-dependent poly(A)-specific ribonuclease subunit 2
MDNQFYPSFINISVFSKCYTSGPYSRAAYAGRLSSPMKTAKPSTQSELEDMSRVLSAACEKKESNETSESDSLFTRLLGIKQEKVNTCTRCKDVKINHDIMHLCNLIYPDAATQDVSNEVQKRDLTDIICSSLCPEQTTPAWCDKCRKYQTTTQTRNIKSMPCVLSLNCGNDNPQDVAFWQSQHELLYADNAPQEENKPVAHVQQPPPNVKPCRYGIGCTRPDCKFWHPEADLTNQQNVDIGAKCAKLGISWIPSNITLHRHEDGKISHGKNSAQISNSPIVETNVYELYGVCSVILDPSNGQANNIVASINVGPTYHARVASPVSQWYVFNDFSINIISPEEALSVNLSWKIPVVLFYQAREIPQPIKEINLVQPITADVFSEDKSLTQSRTERNNRKRLTFIPLQADEMPKKGNLVAIDAEFVTLNQEESELRSDGKVSTIKAAQMSVARITCVRGSGPFEGSPFIDDYISTQEQVVDYVTKFSGIKPGDLDANFSSKHLTTLKSTYKKVRYLIDTGCTFIGHGLKNDFKGNSRFNMICLGSRSRYPTI